MNTMDAHFSLVAGEYNRVRTTDSEPISYLRGLFTSDRRFVGLDVGCGPGRYAKLLLEMIPGLQLICLDRNKRMLAETERLLRSANIDRFKLINANAAEIPLDSHSIDVVFTFNAVHLFDFNAFLNEARRLVKRHGMIAIYTRLLSQNAASIWGRYFPDFTTVERRLYSLDSLDAAIRGVPGLSLDTIKLFQFDRVSSLDQLIAKVRAGHYSTFDLYGKEHLENCMLEFRERVTHAFSDPEKIRWVDGNVLLTVSVSAT